MTANDYNRLFNDFNKQNIMIIGDIMVDAYIFGNVDRISPEAPVPIVSVNQRLSRLGGAANVALNIKALGANPILCAVIGKDAKGDELLDLMEEQSMTTEGIIQSGKRITTTKFRVIGNKMQLLRVDEEVTNDLHEKIEEELISSIWDILENKPVDAIIFQDYNKGVLTEKLIRQVIKKAIQLNIPTCVDPKKKNFLSFENTTLFKPNLKEVREGLDLSIRNKSLKELTEAAQKLHNNLGIKHVMITLSEAGVFISSMHDNKLQTHIIPAHIRNIADVSGAGDTVVSVASLCLSLGINPKDLAAISNLAGGLVCEEVGVVPIDKTKLLDEVIQL